MKQAGLMGVLCVVALCAQASDLRSRIAQIKLDKVVFEDASALRILTWLDEQADAQDPEAKGINFLIQDRARLEKQVLTVDLQNVPLTGALDVICQATNSTYRYDEHAIIVFEKVRATPKADGKMDVRAYDVKPSTFSE